MLIILQMFCNVKKKLGNNFIVTFNLNVICIYTDI